MTTTLVGPIVGPVGALPAGASSSLSDDGTGFDVSVGGLGFKLAISDERPYERATAQFRKEQFDNSPSYGDQSLLGYWTRGQFSFHKGAGVRYYEVSDGEEILNRFDTATGVVIDEPGEVTLAQDTTDWTTTSFTLSGNIRAATCLTRLYLLDATTVRFSIQGAALTSYTLVSGSPRAITSDDEGFVWLGTSAGANAIERAVGGATTGTTLYTHTTGIRDVAYAKGRLFVRDDAGSFYQLPAHPTAARAIAATDLVFTMTNETSDKIWYFCETQGGVYAARPAQRLIYHIGVDPDGAVPTMSAPVVAAELPEGETLYTLGAYLGFVIMVTSRGLRVGLQQTGGALVYGPLIVEGAATLHGTISARGSIVYAAVGDDVIAVNLGESIGEEPLRFAYTIERTITGARGTLRGGEIVWGNTVAKSTTSDLLASATLTTAFHRYGTLEPKKFQSVKVRVSGTGGTVTVSRVMSDGSVVSLYTFDAGDTDGEDITLSLSTPIEMVGLKFTLTRDAADATVGPKLLGYQLRALPAPKRQRLIRLPLKLMDVERTGSTRARGYEGAAWARLAALEDMEQSGGTFTYQDFRTGEAGEVYIEAVEHKGVTPPGKQGNGFGGFIFLTLRKL